MVKQYLLNYQQELLEKKIDMDKSLQKVELLMKENQEFIRFIQNSEDKSYDSFSPQNYRNDKNIKKKKELKEKQEELREQSTDLENEIEYINQKIIELDSIIKLIKTKSEKEPEEVDDNEIFRLKLLETQEYERQRIARDLHDSTVQSLTSMIHKIEICGKLMDMDPNRCKLELQNLSKTVRETIHDMREVIYNLRPMSLDDIGIDVTIEQELDRLRKNHNIKITCNTSGNSDDLLPVIGLTMLRIIKEACNNTIKHSGAENIIININYKENEIQMEILDDGCGFDVSEVRSISNGMDTGFGISIMHERVYLLSGTINIESEKDKGTNIFISIPKKGEK